jgi:DNA repair protein SbcD/Mre11
MVVMRILHTSNIELGKPFDGLTAGDKLRAAMKRSLSRIIDLALAEKADLVIFAGDTFSSVDVSQNLIKYFLSEIRRLESVPVFILPGEKDYYQKGSFWEEWETIPPSDNLHLLTSTERPYIEMPNLSTTIYGCPLLQSASVDNPIEKLRKFGKSRHHIAVVYGNLVHDNAMAGHNNPFHPDDLMASGFNYVALGGQKIFRDFSGIGIRAAYAGAPEMTSYTHLDQNGTVAMVVVEDEILNVESRQVGNLVWKELTLSMESVINTEELKAKIMDQAGADVIQKMTLEGLALLEAGVNLDQLYKELQGNFMYLEFVDHTQVLPDNISAVKVQEKTILGQYLKVMVDKLNEADGSYRTDLEESLKVGYTLLTGKELW